MPDSWQLQAAKNRLSEVVDRALAKGPQTITRHGKPAVVVISVKDFNKRRKGGLIEFFRNSPLKGVRLDLERSKDTGRDVVL